MKSNNDHWCRHYNGVALNATCKAGVTYSDVATDGTPLKTYPCFDPTCDTCPKREYRTRAEVEAEHAQIQAFIDKSQALWTGQSNECPYCGAEVLTMRQIRRCVYSYPCGCRQGQGKLHAAWGGTD